MEDREFLCPYCGDEEAYYPAHCAFCGKTIKTSYHNLLTRLREAVGEIENESVNGSAPSGVFNYDNVWQDSADKCWRILHKYFRNELEKDK